MRQRTAIVGLLAVVCLLVAGIMLARDANAAVAHLRGVETHLRNARAAFEDGELEAGQEAVTLAQTATAAARMRTDGPLWALARSIPRYGASADAARFGIDLADAAADLASAVGEEAAAMLEDGAAAFVDDDGRIQAQALDELATTLDGLPVEPVEAARDALIGLDAGDLFAQSLRGRDDAVGMADEALELIDRARESVAAFAGFFGADGPRTYLIAVQNPGELRGTGGLISYLARLQIVDGALDVVSADLEVSDDPDDRLTRIGEAGNSVNVLDPVDRPADYAARYDHIAAGAVMQSVNADPDLPTVAPVLLDLYTARAGGTADGVIAVTPELMARVLAATGGPLEVPMALLEDVEGMPTSLTPENIVETLTSTVYDAFGGSNPARRVFDEFVTLAVFERLTTPDWDPVELLHELGEAASERHLQLYSNESSEQSLFELLGIAGELPDEAELEGSDLLAVTAVNAAADKSDVHMGHRFSGQIELGALRQGAPVTARRTGTLTVEVENPLSVEGRDTYIVGTTQPRVIGEPASPRVDDALNRTWFSVWSLPATRAAEVRDFGGATATGASVPFRSTTIHGHRVFDHYLETPSLSSRSFEIDLTGVVNLRREGGEMVYELLLWRQSKAIPDHWDLAITPPPGWRIDSASVDGGGSPFGMGAGGRDGEPVTVEVADDGSAHLVGAVTRDTTLTLRFAD